MVSGLPNQPSTEVNAEALGRSQDAEKLNEANKEIYGGDDNVNRLSETVNAEAETEDA